MIEECDVQFEFGDMFFFLSDGFVEVWCVGMEEMFGFDCLEDSLSCYVSCLVIVFCSGIVEDFEDFIDSGLSFDFDFLKCDDDLMLFVVKVF